MNREFTPSFDGSSSVGEAITVPMERLRRKGVGMAAAEAAWLGIQHVIDNNTTLNQHFDILPDVRHRYPQDQYKCGWFMVGVNGYKPGISEDGRPTKDAYQSDPQDLQLYMDIPMSMRTMDNQLSPSEAANYRLKYIKEHNGVQYVAYSARVLDTKESVAKTYMRKTTETVPLEYVYPPEALTPTPKLPPAEGETTEIVANMLVLTSIGAHLSAFDVAELKNVTKILFGRSEDISEIAFIQGAERNISDSDASGATYERKELIDAQVCMTGYTMIPISVTASAIPSAFRVGASEPLFTSSAE